MYENIDEGMAGGRQTLPLPPPCLSHVGYREKSVQKAVKSDQHPIIH